MTTRFRRMWSVRVLLLVAALGVLLASVLAERQRRASLGAVRLTDAGPGTPTAVRIADAAGDVVVPWSPPPIDAPIVLPEGTYRIDAMRPDMLSTSALFDISRDEVFAHPLDLASGRMGSTIPLDRSRGDSCGFVAFGDRRDLLIVRGNGNGLERHDLVADIIRWDVRPDAESARALGNAVPLPEARRLDGDEEPDVVFGNAGGLVAVSGKTGQHLWTARPGNSRPLVEPARWLADVDGDGADDLAWLASRRGRSSRVEARSGRDGHPLWGADLVPGSSPSALVVAELDGRAAVIAPSSAGVLLIDAAKGRPRPVDLGAAPSALPIPLDRDGDDSNDHVLVCCSTTCHLLDARAGRQGDAPLIWSASADPPGWRDAEGRPVAGPAIVHAGEGPLAVESIRAGRSAWEGIVPGALAADEARQNRAPLLDVNGDGGIDVIAIRPINPPAHPPSVPTFQLPDLGPVASDDVAIRAVDGTNGNLLWSASSRINNKFDPARTIEAAAGPDLDGDGVPEVFLASLALGTPIVAAELQDRRESLFVEARSGATGAPIWWWRHERIEDEGSRTDPLRWWSRGPGSAPALVVSLAWGDRRVPERAFVLRAEDGELLHEHAGNAHVDLIDLDGDGIDELTLIPSEAEAGAVAAWRGTGPTAWRRLGQLAPTADLDGDGREDAQAVEMRGSVGSLWGFAGDDGRTLWQARPRGPGNLWGWGRCGDLDGDGIADFLGPSVPFAWVSGRTGRSFATDWDDPESVGQLFGDHLLINFWEDLSPKPTTVDLDGDGTDELVLTYTRPSSEQMADGDGMMQRSVLSRRPGWERRKSAAAPPPSETVVVGYDARGGRARWTTALVQAPERVSMFARVQVAELDGMPGRDLVTISIDETRNFQVRALRGRDGRELWSRPAGPDVDRLMIPPIGAPELAPIDLDGDGIDEVVIADRFEKMIPPALSGAPDEPSPDLGRLVVKALEGRDGAERWSWIGPPTAALGWQPRLPVRDFIRLRAARRDPARGGPVLWVDRVDRLPNEAFSPGGLIRRRTRLDARGLQLDAAEAPIATIGFSGQTTEAALGAWVAGDPDGDGNDAVVRFLPDTGRLQAFLDGQTSPFWERALPARISQLPFLRLETRGDRTAILVSDPDVDSGRTALILDLATGEPTPLPEAGSTRAPLAGGGPSRRLVVDRGMSWVEAPGDLPINLRVSGLDPRLARPLPWADEGSIRLVLAAMPAALVLVALPLGMLIVAVRARSLRWSLAGVAMIALAFAAARGQWLKIDVNDDLRGPRWRAAQLVAPAFAPMARLARAPLEPMWLHAAVGLPPLALLAACWAWRRRWRRVILAFGVAAGLVALAWWAWDLRSMGPSEYHTNQGWYLIGFWGAYALGVVAIVGAIPAAIVRERRTNRRDVETSKTGERR